MLSVIYKTASQIILANNNNNNPKQKAIEFGASVSCIDNPTLGAKSTPQKSGSKIIHWDIKGELQDNNENLSSIQK